jgi:hypothetical protein
MFLVHHPEAPGCLARAVQGRLVAQGTGQ